MSRKDTEKARAMSWVSDSSTMHCYLCPGPQSAPGIPHQEEVNTLAESILSAEKTLPPNPIEEAVPGGGELVTRFVRN